MGRRLVLAALLCAVICAPTRAQSVVVEKDGFRLRVSVQGALSTITVEAKATGWLAVGLDPDGLGMKGADFLLGYVKDGVTLVRDDFGVGPMSHASDESQGGTNGILSFSGEEQGGATKLTFTVRVDSGDSKDRRWAPGKHVVLLASSNADSFAVMHNARTRLEIVIPEAAK